MASLNSVSILLVAEDSALIVRLRELMHALPGFRLNCVSDYESLDRAILEDPFELCLVDADCRNLSMIERLGEFTDGADAPPLLLLNGNASSPGKQGSDAHAEADAERPAERLRAMLRINKARLTPESLAALVESALESARAEESQKEDISHPSEIEGEAPWSWNLKTHRIRFSSRWRQLIGEKAQSFPDSMQAWLQRVHPTDVHGLKRRLEAIRSGASSKLEMEYRIRHKDGVFRWMLLRGLRQVSSDGSSEILVGTQADITLRKQAEDAIGEDRNILRTLIDNLPDFIYIKDHNGMFLLNNRAHLGILGVNHSSAALGNTDYDFFPREIADMYTHTDKEVLKSGEASINHEEPLHDTQGRRRWISTSKIPLRNSLGQILGLVGISRDITDQVRAEQALRESEEQLRQSQKMEAVGRLAGGVAHDFNNILMAIMGHTELILRRSEAETPIEGHALEIRKAAERAASLTRQLLAFSRRQVLQSKVLNLNDVIGEMEKMLRRLIGEDVQLVTDLDAELGNVRADPGQVEQVIMNLAVNARDAMPDGGVLRISSRNRTHIEDDDPDMSELPDGEYIVLSVQDTGKGIHPEDMPHLFEPFYTTKEKGKGTGLGLSTVYGIVKQSGGEVSVSSAPKEGSIFRIFLPRVMQKAPKLNDKHKTRTQMPSGSETILLVEDENAVRKLVREVLELNGYQVIEALDGEHAYHLALDNGDRISLLLTDVVMPRMGGHELSEKLLQRLPSLKVLFMSGYSEWEPSSTAPKPLNFLQKPFSPDVLSLKVRETLDKKQE